MDGSSQEEQVYQYYTIVNDSSNVIANNQDEPVLFLTFKQEEDEDDVNQEILSIEEGKQKKQDVNESFLSNLKLITLEDGRMFVTTTNTEEENLTDIKSHFLSNVNEENVINKGSVIVSDEQAENSELHEIVLEDGSRAVIDINLLKSLANTNKGKNEKKFPCLYDYCDKVYTTQHHLRVHMRNHTGCRPYQCTVEGCDKAFSTGYSLKAHIRTHTGEKPYGCSLCSKHFKTSGDLQKHIRTHTGEKPFTCPIEGCGRSFTTSNIRKVHIRSHTGERPYSCDYPNCGKAFASATNYKNHTRIHSGEKPYVCNVAGCGKRFTEYSSLYKHNMVHKPDKPFICQYCGQQCKQESTLRAHKRTIHNAVITADLEITVSEQDNSLSGVVIKVPNNDINENDYLFLEDDVDGSI